MSRRDDHGLDMPAPPSPLLDDDTIEALLAGDDVPTSTQHLAAFVGDVRAVGARSAPRPSHRLADLLAGHEVEPLPSLPDATETIVTRPVHRSRPRRSLAARVAGASLAVKIGMGATVAAAGVLSAGALDVVPGAPGEGLRKMVEAVTPLHADDADDSEPPARDGGGAPAQDGEPGAVDGTAGEQGDRVSSDATGESDGVPGVEGPSVADTAPGAGNRPDEVGPPEADGSGPPATDDDSQTDDSPGESPRGPAGGQPVPGTGQVSGTPPTSVP